MEKSDGFGLSVEYDEESGSFDFEWDPETHPEWGFLADLTSDEFCKMILERAEAILNEHENTEVHTGGQSGGAAEGDCNSESECGNAEENPSV
jgi:hypothetical protein